ncbi:hypothetical protein LCGC14_0282240 [marine sediment metagenome]|uniref:Uncharacterized protein n=1 Tax=marine sediment metagenome TaxID=412755 RepID=A0A0F9TVI9_9ZZZZ
MLLKLSLYWVKPHSKPLLAVAAASEHHAASLFKVHQHSIRRNGGKWSGLQDGELPQPMSEVLVYAMRRPGHVFRFEGIWRRICRKTTINLHNGSDCNGISVCQQSLASPKAMGVRTLSLNVDERNKFESLGGARWLRDEIAKANVTEEAIAPSRQQAGTYKPMSLRISSADWDKFQQLGGKTWLLVKMVNSKVCIPLD